MEASCILKKNYPQPNLTSVGKSPGPSRNSQDDHSRVVLTADKGVAMAVMDREDYTNKAHQLLSDTNMYKPIPKDPTSKPKNKLAQTLRDIKNQGGLSDIRYKIVYPTCATTP